MLVIFKINFNKQAPVWKGAIKPVWLSKDFYGSPKKTLGNKYNPAPLLLSVRGAETPIYVVLH